jgi:hypothetical protein
MGLKMKKMVLIIAIMGQFICGCASLPSQKAPSLNTPAGKPEVIVTKLSKAELKEILLKKMSKLGYKQVKSSDNKIDFIKDITNFWTNFVYGTKYGRTTEMRIVYFLREEPFEIKISAEMKAVTNPESQFEKIRDVSRNCRMAEEIQEFLNDAFNVLIKKK